MASPAAMPISTRNTQFTSQIRYRAKDAAATATLCYTAGRDNYWVTAAMPGAPAAITQ